MLRLVNNFTVKTVDMHSKNWNEVLIESFKNTGFAVLTNHEIDNNALNSLYSQWAGFFSSEKKNLYKVDANTGYIPFGVEKAKDSDKTDLKEFYHLPYPFSSLPEGVDQIQIDTLMEGMMRVARNLLFVLQPEIPKDMAQIHGEPLHKMIKESDKNLLRILHYPPIENAEGAVRAADHEDINLITLLPAATQPGLEVKDLMGNWHKIECDPGSIIVNVGDMLQEASRGVFMSTTHRVVNPDSAANVSRYSMPFFVHPRSEVRLSNRYTAGAYLNQRLEEIGLLKKGGGNEKENSKKDQL